MEREIIKADPKYKKQLLIRFLILVICLAIGLAFFTVTHGKLRSSSACWIFTRYAMDYLCPSHPICNLFH